MYRSSRIIAEAVKIEPFGSHIADRDTFCCMCGAPIETGENVTESPLKGQTAFTDELSMAFATSRMACQWCTPFVAKGYSKANMALAANKVHTRQGSFVLTKDAERVAFFLQPPSPPYVVVLNEGTNTLHHAWCAEVTLDNEQIAVRFGKQNLIIRHSKLMKAVELCEEAAQLLNENNNSKNKVKKVFTHPYKVLDRNLSDLNHGQFKDDSLLLAHTNPRMAEILDILSDNTLGETWALAALVKAKKEEPVINQFKPVC
ncbi:MAG: hypothetical protein PHI97_00635 [Desulfobulbus sp.]|nr:hypothetical protein [Desulfobulbus sp.]